MLGIYIVSIIVSSFSITSINFLVVVLVCVVVVVVVDTTVASVYNPTTLLLLQDLTPLHPPFL